MFDLRQTIARLPMMEPLNRCIEWVLFRANIHQRIQSCLLIGTEKRTRQTLNSPIFVVGCPHSGTSVMLAILDTHPNIRAIDRETYVFFRRSFLKIPEFHAWNRMTLADGKHRWAEKTAEHIGRLDKIFGYYPDAKVIMMLRDGRDVACSVKKRTGSFTEGVDWWLKWNNAGRKYWTHDNVMVVRYENLVTQTHDMLRMVFEFLNEPFHTDLLDFTSRQRDWYTNTPTSSDDLPPTPDAQGELRNWQINQPLFDGRGRWKNEMADSERKQFMKCAGQSMADLGYNLEYDVADSD